MEVVTVNKSRETSEDIYFPYSRYPGIFPRGVKWPVRESGHPKEKLDIFCS